MEDFLDTACKFKFEYFKAVNRNLFKKFSTISRRSYSKIFLFHSLKLSERHKQEEKY